MTDKSDSGKKLYLSPYLKFNENSTARATALHWFF